MITTHDIAEQAAELYRSGWPLDRAIREAARRTQRPARAPDPADLDPLPPITGPLRAVVIPAFNEARTVGRVIRAFRDCPGIGQVIVVDDESDDDTADVAAAAGAGVVPGPGVSKGEACKAGLAHVTLPRVIFCDADLRRFTWRHAALLAQDYPGQIVGVFPGVHAYNSGMRALPTRVARALDLSGYSMEWQLTMAVLAAGLHTRVIDLTGVVHPARATSPSPVRPNAHRNGRAPRPDADVLAEARALLASREPVK